MTAAEPQNRPTASEVAKALRADMTQDVQATRVVTTPLAAPTAGPSHAPTVDEAEAHADGASPKQGGRQTTLFAAVRDAAGNRWILAGTLLLTVMIAVLIALASSGDAGSSEETPPAAPGSQLDKDLAELRNAVTP